AREDGSPIAIQRCSISLAALGPLDHDHRRCAAEHLDLILLTSFELCCTPQRLAERAYVSGQGHQPGTSAQDAGHLAQSGWIQRAILAKRADLVSEGQVDGRRRD